MKAGDLDRKVRVARWIGPTPSEGPYERFALWVQGCDIRCPGCCNPEMQDPAVGQERSVEELLEMIFALSGIEGLTFLGGEPFEQAEALGVLAAKVTEAGLGVITFSGYSLEHLKKRPTAFALLGASDLLVAGPYIKEQHLSNRRFIGSANQEIYFLTDRYRNCPEFSRPGQSVHLSFSKEKITITGFPDMFPENVPNEE